MKLYLVHTHIVGDTIFQWTGTQADCAKLQREYIDQGAKRSDIKIDEIDVPTDKKGLLEFLNKGGIHDA